MATIVYERWKGKVFTTETLRVPSNNEVIAAAQMKLKFTRRIWENEISIVSFNGKPITHWRWV